MSGLFLLEEWSSYSNKRNRSDEEHNENRAGRHKEKYDESWRYCKQEAENEHNGTANEWGSTR